MMYNAVKVEKGEGGWGESLLIRPDQQKSVVVSVTGGGIHPVAQRIADLTGAVVRDGFKQSIPAEEMACVVIDCGGTARCGVYPKMGVLTINVKPTSPAGPLARYIKEENFVSGVRERNISLVEETSDKGATETDEDERKAQEETPTEEKQDLEETTQTGQRFTAPKTVEKVVRGVSHVANVFYQSGRESTDLIIKNVIPFMVFASALVGILLFSGLMDWLSFVIQPLAGNLIGLLLIAVVASLPFFSPLIGPGAVLAQLAGVLIGVEIARGNIPPHLALPALFAINPQVGCDFASVGMTLGEAKPETVEAGVPAVLISRQITGPLAVIIAYFISLNLY